MHQLTLTLESLPVITIAAMNGFGAKMNFTIF